ncbi:GNAT family N-acetyltransferase [Vogesella sp. EB]|uniref:GNAT family N-acetyltransferase n=1 Tax=Vogesella sp. EB TaxID=1526735 RepID=UPI0012E076DE|nr:GNAT family N-acetyltransferase [Vogesella sp. EB]
MSTLRIERLSDEHGHITQPQILAAALAVHRQLRPMLPETAADYVAKMARITGYGARLVAALNEDDQVLGLALYRVYENTYEDLRLYIDDLVTDERLRSQGVGSALIDWCEAEARALGCRFLVLDSGTWRTAAHKLYLRKEFVISSFHFTRALD